MKQDSIFYTIDTDKIDPAIDTINRMQRFEAEVGIFDKDVVKYAIKQEYGATNKDGTIIPPRSFLRATATNKDNMNAIINYMAEKVRDVFFIRGAKSAPTFHKIEEIFVLASQILEKAIVNRIWSNIPPPLSKRRLAEKKAKESPFPEIALIDTGRMVSSITYKIIRKNPD